MKKNPKVSVLTPLYNTNPTDLCAMIESILSQTFTDFEFLLLNDSPDNKQLSKIVQSYKDSRIKYFENDANLGITKSRNKLIDLAKGEYLAVVDHDDISMPNRFELEVNFLDKNPHVGVVGGNLTESVDGKRWTTTNYPENDNEIKISLVNQPYVCVPNHPTCMIRKSVLIDNNIKYDEKWTPCEDHSLLLDLMDYTCFHNLPDVVLKYVWHGDNTTIRQRQRMVDLLPVMINAARRKYPIYYNEYKFRQENTCHNAVVETPCESNCKNIKLFGFLPLLKIKKQHGQKKVYLFNCIQLLRIK